MIFALYTCKFGTDCKSGIILNSKQDEETEMKKATLLVMVWIFAGFLALLYVTPAHAAPIWGSDASGNDLTSTRTSSDGGGVDATEEWNNGGFTIEWNISQGTDKLWTYIYNLTGYTKEFSHFILEFTKDNNPYTININEKYEGPREWSLSTSNPLMPNPIYGVKFDYGDSTNVTYTMVTDRAPVWGVFYTKDGVNDDTKIDVVAWSTALNSSDYRTNESLTTTDFIVRPDGGVPIPEPSTILLVGTGLLGLIGFKRKRLNKKA